MHARSGSGAEPFFSGCQPLPYFARSRIIEMEARGANKLQMRHLRLVERWENPVGDENSNLMPISAIPRIVGYE